MTLSTDEGFHVKGSRRNFIDSKTIEWYLDEDILIINEYQAAWAIDVLALAALSEQFGVDLKIYAFEKGMEFNQDIEIHNGAIIRNQEVKFNNYQWDCIFPNLGG